MTAGIPYDQFLVDFIEECCSEAYSDGKLDGAGKTRGVSLMLTCEVPRTERRVSLLEGAGGTEPYLSTSRR